MKQLEVTVTAESPIVLTTESNATVMTETHDTISGSVLRGVIAKQYIEARNLKAGAHNDEEFRRLFFGALHFVDANIACPDTGKRSFVIPLSMQKEKAKEGLPEVVEDLTRAEDPTKGMKSFRGYAVLTDDNLIKTVSASKDISLHMSRMSDEERKKGRSEEGGIYNYESIDAGQKFVGLVIGEDADISALCSHFPDGEFKCRIGRSKFTQYGRCQIEMKTPPKEVAKPSAKDLEEGERKLILSFDSPFIFGDPKMDATGACVMATAENVLDTIAHVMNERTEEGSFHIETPFAADAEIENYVGVWSMKRPRERALAAGSVFALVKDTPWTEADFEALTDLMYRGVGRRTEEGFGQLRLWPKTNGKWIKPESTEVQKPVSLSFKKATPKVEEIARQAFEHRLIEQIRMYAAEDAKNSRHTQKGYDLSGFTHFFSRLDHFLDDEQAGRDETGRKQTKSAGFRESFRNRLRKEVRPKGPMESNLKNILAPDRSLYDMLMRETTELPITGRPWIKDIGTNEERTKAFMQAVGLEANSFDLTDGHYFYEYWHWFFRCARKRAVTKQDKGAANDV